MSAIDDLGTKGFGEILLFSELELLLIVCRPHRLPRTFSTKLQDDLTFADFLLLRREKYVRLLDFHIV